MMRLIKNQQTSASGAVQPVAKRRRIVFIPQQVMRHDEARMRRPGVHREPALLPHAPHIIAIENYEREAEALVQLLLPLEHNRRRRGHDDATDALAHEQLANDEASLDGLSEAHIVRDEEIHAWQQQSLAKWLELIRVDANARTVGRLEQFGIARGDRVPAQRVVLGTKLARVIEVPPRQLRPVSGADALGIDFLLPENLELFPFRVVLEAGEPNQGLVLRLRRGFHPFHKVSPRPYAYRLALLGWNIERYGHRGFR